MNTRTLILACAALAVLGGMLCPPALASGSGVSPYAWLTPHASSYGDRIDFLYELIYVIVIIVWIGVQSVMCWFLWRYRARPESGEKAVYHHGSDLLEVIWTVTPALMLLFIALVQRDAWLDIKTGFPDPSDPNTIKVQCLAQRYTWEFRYAGQDKTFGTADDLVSKELLVIPKGKKVLMLMRSYDVLHSFFLPHMRVKQDAVPGLTVPVWWEATLTTKEYAQKYKLPLHGKRAFHYEVACAELCGAEHYSMDAEMRVVTYEQYLEWLEDNDPVKKAGGDRAPLEDAFKQAKRVYNQAQARLRAKKTYDRLHHIEEHGHLTKELGKELKAAKKLIKGMNATADEALVKAHELKYWGWGWDEKTQGQTTKNKQYQPKLTAKKGAGKSKDKKGGASH